ncbi:MAG: hypothetical protein AVDCRST_MAG19-1164 [uncultured Thermomicrobiales bacterium]|uniref:Uncharacterized protein n=1 Tax=uncultured Thermomicrobiales bacterium TaxID=1645740 RepID=A0A6J4UMR8_9BACT|nr:MAG: hypothetical protein AVDCRST_MAG19-1164 [uncultured Thermomicrobiales bacterium]
MRGSQHGQRRLRRVQTSIGRYDQRINRAPVVPPSTELPVPIDGSERILAVRSDTFPLVRPAFAPHRFETIDPVKGGNKWLGRTLIALLLGA